MDHAELRNRAPEATPRNIGRRRAPDATGAGLAAPQCVGRGSFKSEDSWPAPMWSTVEVLKDGQQLGSPSEPRPGPSAWPAPTTRARHSRRASLSTVACGWTRARAPAGRRDFRTQATPAQRRPGPHQLTSQGLQEGSLPGGWQPQHSLTSDFLSEALWARPRTHAQDFDLEGSQLDRLGCFLQCSQPECLAGRDYGGEASSGPGCPPAVAMVQI